MPVPLMLVEAAEVPGGGPAGSRLAIGVLAKVGLPAGRGAPPFDILDRLWGIHRDSCGAF